MAGCVASSATRAALRRMEGPSAAVWFLTGRKACGGGAQVCPAGSGVGCTHRKCSRCTVTIRELVQGWNGSVGLQPGRSAGIFFRRVSESALFRRSSVERSTVSASRAAPDVICPGTLRSGRDGRRTTGFGHDSCPGDGQRKWAGHFLAGVAPPLSNGRGK